MTDIDTTQIDTAAFEGTIAFVGTEDGLTVTQLSTDTSKELARVRCGTVADIDARDRLCLATSEDVVTIDQPDGTMRSTGFGPASAVTAADDELLAGDDNGRVARYDDGNWATLGIVGAVRAIDRHLVGARDGVYRIVDDGLVDTGLNNVRDVSAMGQPLVATADALYYLGPGWATALKGPFSAVDADGERAYATTEDELYERIDGEWEEIPVPVSTSIADIDHTEPGYVASTDGAIAINAADGWQTQSLEVDDVTALAVRRY